LFVVEVPDMKVRAPDGKVYAAEFTADHSASSYGLPVLVVAGLVVLGPGDVTDWSLVESTTEEADRLWAEGYRLRGAGGAL
jgi:hypothetical protein